MDAEQVRQAAQLLVEARRTGKPLRELPASCKPANTADVNAIVDAVTAQLDEAIGGWKIGFVYSPRQKPFICPMFRSRLFSSPARVPLSLTPSLRIEPEISFKLTRDLPPRRAAFKPQEVAEALVACASLEIVDTRFDTRHRSIRQMLDDRAARFEAFADHNTTGAYITAEGRGDWQEFEFAAMRMVMRTPRRVIVETVVLANEMRHRQGLKAGDLLVTGSFCGFFEVGPDEPVSAEFENFGVAEATFTSR